MFVLLLCLWVTTPLHAKMNELYQWKTLPFNFPDDETRSQYNETTTFPMDADMSSTGTVYVTVPRFYPGVPATLTTVVEDSSGQPILDAYPSWDANRQGNCDGITSVLRIKMDTCQRLWVLDSGKVDIILDSSNQLCQPKVVMYDTKSNSQKWQYIIPDQQYTQDSLFSTIAVDVRGDCSSSDVFLYLADMTGYGLVVVNYAKQTSWRLEGDYFKNDPSASNFSIDGVQFYLPDGLVSLALSPLARYNRKMYFHALAGQYEYLVDTQELRSGQTGELSVKRGSSSLPGQSGPADMYGYYLIFSSLPQNALYCWNSRTLFRSTSLIQVYRDNELFQFASGLKVINNYVLTVTSRFQNLMVGQVNTNDVNYRVLLGSAKQLTDPCQYRG